MIRKEQFQEALQRRMKFSRKKPLDRIPLNYMVIGAPVKYDMIERCNSSAAAVEQFLINEKHTLENFPEGDHIPIFNLDYLGEGVIPSMFGAEQVPVKDLPPFTRGRVMDDLETDLPKLKQEINPETDGWGPIAKDAVERFIDATRGEIRVTNVDIQSPYGIATKLIGNEKLMFAMYDTPELVHELFDICTKAIIDTTNAVIKWAGGAQNVALNVCEPYDDTGISMYDDYVSVISPDLSNEFCLPHNQKIFEAFGGRGYYHTCGPYFPGYMSAVLANKPRIMDMVTLRGALQKSREDMLEVKKICVQNDIFLSGDLAAYPNGQYDFDSHIQPDEDFVRRMCADGRTLWTAWGTAERGRELLEYCRECINS